MGNYGSMLVLVFVSGDLLCQLTAVVSVRGSRLLESEWLRAHKVRPSRKTSADRERELRVLARSLGLQTKRILSSDTLKIRVSIFWVVRGAWFDCEK